MLAETKFSPKIEKILIETIRELYSKYKITDKYKELTDEQDEIHRIYEYAHLDAKK
jgi:hypothetical protein